MKADVLVLGGGSAGLAAAVASARRGARTVLVERHGFAGGMGVASLVHTFCGLYLSGGEEPVLANPGIAAEIEALTREATGQQPVKMGRVWVLRQHPVDFAAIADRLLKAAGVEVMFHSEAISLAEKEAGWRLGAACRGAVTNLEAAALVDASGDAIAAALLGGGAEITPAAHLQRPAYIFGIRVPGPVETGLPLAAHLVAGVREGALPAGALGLQFRPSGREGEIFGTLDLSAQEEAYDPLSPACLSALESTGREVARAALAYLGESVAGWRGAYISHWPARAGVRESRCWLGRAILTGAEILSGARHADDIALAAWPLEMRESNRGPKLRYAVDDLPAGIPFGSLRPEKWDRLFVAGRCLSCDHDAQASVRVMGTCFATGEAAGVAAAIAASGRDPVAGEPGLEAPQLKQGRRN